MGDAEMLESALEVPLPSPASASSEPQEIHAGIPAKRSKKKVSPMWAHFRKGDQKIDCLHCRSAFSLSSSTGTLESHLESSHKNILTKMKNPPPVPAAFRPKDNPKEKPLSDKQAKKIDALLIRWIVARSKPFSTVDEPEFRELVSALNSNYKLCHRTAVKDRVLRDYKAYKDIAISELQKAEGRFSISLDTWTSDPKDSFIIVTVHWVDGSWTMRSMPLDFVILPASQTGANLMEIVFEVLQEFRIAHRILGYTGDGSGNIRTCFEALTPKLSLVKIKNGVKFELSEFRVRCICHCLHLVAEIPFIKQKTVVDKVRRIRTFLESPKAKREFKENFAVVHLKLPSDVETRWYSTKNMLRGGYNLREKLDEFVQLQSGAIRNSMLTAAEWDIVEQLVSLTEPFESASIECEGSRYPTFHLGVRTIQHILRHLAEASLLTQGWLKEAAVEMKKKLDSIIADNWSQDIMLLAAALDPCLKLAGIPEVLKPNAEAALKKALGLYSKKAGLNARESVTLTAEIPEKPQKISLRDKYINELSQTSVCQDELQDYLHTALAKNCQILDYWKVNESKYVVLSKLARDILGVQASSAQSEREFSKSGKVVTDLRNRLGSKSIQAVLCLKSWYSFDKNESSAFSVIELDDE